MQRIILAAAAAFALAASAASHARPFFALLAPIAEDTETVRNPAPDAPYARAQAPDHVVTMEADSGLSWPRLRRTVVTRSGDWLRLDQTSEHPDGRVLTVASYSNIATGVSVTAGRDERGRPNYLLVRRHPADSPFSEYTRVRTGERDTLLGETCGVWRAMGRISDPGPVWLNCVTEDGVELWSRTLYSSGEVMGFARAISVVRRRVDASEVRPPPDALDWQRWWRNVAAIRNAPNDEVILTSRDGGQMMIRRRAGWTYREGGSRVYRNLAVTHEASGIYLRYNADSDGPLELYIEGRPVDPEIVDLPTRANGDSDTVLGERCTWSDASGGGIVIAGHTECRTRDGMVLGVRRTMHRAPRPLEFRATRIRRGVVSEADMQPPAEAFSWARQDLGAPRGKAR